MDDLIRDQTLAKPETTSKNNNNKRIDCKMSEWKRMICNVTDCGEGFRVKTRHILVHPKNGGKRCPSKLQKNERCYVKCEGNRGSDSPNVDSRETINDADCKYSAWGPWSPCSKSCGEGAIQQRTRHVISSESSGFCNQRVEERVCSNILPCMFG